MPNAVFGSELFDDCVLEVRGLARYPYVRSSKYSSPAGGDVSVVGSVCLSSRFQPALCAEIIIDDMDILVIPVALAKEEVAEVDDLGRPHRMECDFEWTRYFVATLLEYAKQASRDESADVLALVGPAKVLLQPVPDWICAAVSCIPSMGSGEEAELEIDEVIWNPGCPFDE